MAMNKQTSAAVINNKTLNDLSGVIGQNEDRTSSNTLPQETIKQRVMQLAASRATLTNLNDSG